MISDNDKKRVNDIENGLKSIEANLDNLGFVYKIAGKLFGFCDSLEDKDLKFNLKGELAKIMQTQHKEEIQHAIKSIFSFIDEVEKDQPKTKREVKKEERLFENLNIDKADEYLKDCIKYSAYKKNIKELEKKITSSEFYQKKLHEKITSGKRWKDHYHARLTGNLRIMYSWDPDTKILKFERILTKNELEKD